MSRRGIETTLVALAIAALSIGGCQLVTGADDFEFGTAGSATGGATGMGGHGGGAAACSVPEDCPGAQGDCVTRTCSAGTCGVANLDAGSTCNEAGGTVCNGQGSCVECLDIDDCAPDEVCSMQLCLPEQCVDQTLNGDESDVDCGGSVCPACEDGKLCGRATDCMSQFCDTGAGNGGGGGGTRGVCAACVDDVDCAAAGSSWCNAGVCTAHKPLGAACLDANECASGFCPTGDGVCCDSACEATCEACTFADTGVVDGTCAAVGAGTDPAGECPMSSPTTCGAIGMGCNGDAANPGCLLYGSQTECVAPSCNTGTNEATSPGICDGQGMCVLGTTSSCDPYICSSGLCPSSCSVDAECVTSHHCSAGNCVADLANGQACASNGQCVSGFCVDGFCCDAACSGTCEACSQAKTGQSDGQCSAVIANTDPDAECPLLAPSTCGSTGACNGDVNAPGCLLYDSATVCVVQSCNSGMEQPQQTCDGSGTCVAQAPVACAPYVCNAGNVACLTSCQNDAECSAGNYCKVSSSDPGPGGLNSCQDERADGAACNANTQCESGQCVDGVCCNSGCQGLCRACDLAGNVGTCTFVPANQDPANECPAQIGDALNCDGAGDCQKL